MNDSLPSPVATGEVTLQLLDPQSGRPIKSWTFSNQGEITIGRSPDRDVEMSDPYVSRSHASLAYRDGQWRLISQGRHGVVIGGQLVNDYPVRGEVRFRLGAAGPTLQFRTTPEPNRSTATLSFDSLPVPDFQLDERKLQDEVGELSNSDYFLDLQERAKKLRKHRQAD